jgi:replication initiation and membrane attachment protein
MRITNIHEFTEHHRYYIFRDFSLSVLDLKTIHLIYQPMVGAAAAGLYQLLYYGVEEGKVGYSALEPQRKLFLTLGLDMNDAGRKSLAEHASRLEAVGLLQSSRITLPDGDDLLYEYELQAPLSPEEFFRNQHLTLFLRDKIGKYAVISLREQFSSREPDELAEAALPKENISVPFYELFRLNTQGVDAELEQALSEVAPARQALPKGNVETAGIQYGDLILRFPRNSANRKHVEKLRGDDEQLAALNYVAYKYGLNVADLSRLLDEDELFTAGGELLYDELQLRASGIYRQDRKREVDRQRVIARSSASEGEGGEGREEEAPEEFGVEAEFYLEVPAQLTGRCDRPQYNMLMRNEPHTRFLHRFFPGAVPEWLERLFERVDLSYKLPGAVINVLIHYVLGMNESQRVTKTFIEAVASNMLVKQVDTFEKAVGYLRDQAKVEEQKDQRKNASGGGRSQGTSKRGGYSRGAQKPSIPIVEKKKTGPSVTEAEREEIRKLAMELDGQG